MKKIFTIEIYGLGPNPDVFDWTCMHSLHTYCEFSMLCKSHLNFNLQQEWITQSPPSPTSSQLQNILYFFILGQGDDCNTCNNVLTYRLN
jgi:hypothetical protein